MISNRHITKITLGLMALVLLLCVLLMIYQKPVAYLTSTSGYNMEYPDILFGKDEVMEISIQMNSDKWKEMLQNASLENYYECEVTVGGKTFHQVGIRPKGNTSLSSIARDPSNNRYSFKLEFDHFTEGQTCFGLDKLVLNNNYADITNMKEALIYDMYHYLGAAAPLYQYAKITVNGDYFGIYLALEAVEESFLLRNYGLNYGYLYKPDGMNHNAPDRGGDAKLSAFFQPSHSAKAAGESENSRMKPPGGFDHRQGGGFFGGGGANLNYIDDSLDSYTTIWNSAVNKSETEDHKRVLEALKAIHNGENIESYMDVENLLKYMAVHNFSVNEDSLSGSMAHNYYLYESMGKLNIIPWDYNLAFGGMHGGDATSMVNDPIDDSYASTDFFDVLLEQEPYHSRYHEYYNRLVTEYFEGGVFETTYQRIRSQIDALVETDPNSMYTYQEYLTGAELLYETVLLRKESVKAQLLGTIPATSALQRADSSTLIDASHIYLSQMGKFMGGR